MKTFRDVESCRTKSSSTLATRTSHTRTEGMIGKFAKNGRAFMKKDGTRAQLMFPSRIIPDATYVLTLRFTVDTEREIPFWRQDELLDTNSRRK